jgi:hypothetical protein
VFYGFFSLLLKDKGDGGSRRRRKVHDCTSHICRGFIVVAPSIIQPASVYSVVVTVGSVEENPRLANLLDSKTLEQGVNVRLSLFRNGADIEGSSLRISPGSSDLLKILVCNYS